MAEIHLYENYTCCYSKKFRFFWFTYILQYALVLKAKQSFGIDYHQEWYIFVLHILGQIKGFAVIQAIIAPTNGLPIV